MLMTITLAATMHDGPHSRRLQRYLDNYSFRFSTALTANNHLATLDFHESSFSAYHMKSPFYV